MDSKVGAGVGMGSVIFYFLITTTKEKIESQYNKRLKVLILGDRNTGVCFLFFAVFLYFKQF